MFKIILLLVLAFGIQAKPADQTHLTAWQQFKKTHGKTYATAEEESARYNIFVENVKLIEQHNEEFKAGVHTYDLGMNQFGDMTNAEFTSIMNGFLGNSIPVSNAPVYEASSANDLPAAVDWRDKGYVTGIKDQGQCGSCWAFSATGSLEGQNFKKTGKLVSLSEQNLIDCSRQQGNQGCNGGWMDNAFNYIKSNKGIDTETSYPYLAKDGQCHFNTSAVGATDVGFTDIKSGDETSLQSAVATLGPISVAIDASSNKFQLYKSGVYYNQRCSSRSLDHGVLVVGYGATNDGQKYYIVKNSWGESWGDKGYILMARDRNNNCGIATKASYPLE